MKKALALMIGVAIILSFLPVQLTDASSTGGSGYWRWVLLTATRTNATITANATIPESIYNDSNTDLRVYFTVVNSGTIDAGNYTHNYTVFVTIGSVTRNASVLLNITANTTTTDYATFSRGDVLSGGNTEGNNTLTVTLKEETTQKDTFSGYITVYERGYGLGQIVLLLPVVLVISVFALFFKIIKKSLRM